MSEILPAIEIETAADPDAAVIWLHGLGDTGDGWSQVVPGLGLPRSLRVRFLFPHAPKIPVGINNNYVMPAWYDIRDGNLNERADLAGVRRSQSQLEALVAREKTRGIAEARIVLAGFSQGGAIALYTAVRHPARLAGVGRACRRTSSTRQGLRREAAPANRDLPIFMAHGTYDPVVRIEWARGLAQSADVGRLERRVARVPDGALRRDGGGGRDRALPRAGARVVTRPRRRRRPWAANPRPAVAGHRGARARRAGDTRPRHSRCAGPTAQAAPRRPTTQGRHAAGTTSCRSCGGFRPSLPA